MYVKPNFPKWRSVNGVVVTVTPCEFCLDDRGLIFNEKFDCEVCEYCLGDGRVMYHVNEIDKSYISSTQWGQHQGYTYSKGTSYRPLNEPHIRFRYSWKEDIVNELQKLFARRNDPNDKSCVMCQRAMRDDERFGSGPRDWDQPGRICPECWDESTRDPDDVA